MPSLEDCSKNDSRLLLISNRLPITIKRSEDGKYDFSMSSGGLVSGLSGLSKSTTFQWYGWPGLEVPEEEIPVVKQRLKDEYNAVPWASRGLATTPNGIEFQGKIIACGAFPIGIDPEKFQEGLKKEKVQKRIAQLEQKFQGVKLMVGVDRLDYIKGVPQKLHALEVFLSDHPEWVGKVVLVQVAVPSRQDVEEYQNLRAVVNELVGRINGKFGK
ncbi:unnamed protein product [Aspergillus oryzae]|uniref:Unnamed protein product n=1 Tax=Aspergillus oryzae TaxID=5062 RepID=A0AAN4Y6S7_ASPOZ|nr:unnamed protein product [Aspergillus oryzae]